MIFLAAEGRGLLLRRVLTACSAVTMLALVACSDDDPSVTVGREVEEAIRTYDSERFNNLVAPDNLLTRENRDLLLSQGKGVAPFGRHYAEILEECNEPKSIESRPTRNAGVFEVTIAYGVNCVEGKYPTLVIYTERAGGGTYLRGVEIRQR